MAEQKDVIKYLIVGLLFFVSIIMSNLMIGNTYVTNFPIEENGGIAVNIQDQTTRPVDFDVHRILDATLTITATPTVDSYTVVVSDASGLSVGDGVAFIEENGMPEIWWGKILSISTNTLTLDTPCPHNYNPANTSVIHYSDDLNVDGSTTKVVFGLTNYFNEAVDVTRLISHCTDNVEMHDGLFCGIDELDRGIVFRKKLLDGTYINYWNIKSNGEWAELAYDTQYTDKGKPPDSTYGFNVRLTYAGPSKHGVAIRVEPGESIEILVQDDLTDITEFRMMFEGHFTQD